MNEVMQVDADKGKGRTNIPKWTVNITDNVLQEVRFSNRVIQNRNGAPCEVMNHIIKYMPQSGAMGSSMKDVKKTHSAQSTQSSSPRVTTNLLGTLCPPPKTRLCAYPFTSHPLLLPIMSPSLSFFFFLMSKRPP